MRILTVPTLVLVIACAAGCHAVKTPPSRSSETVADTPSGQERNEPRRSPEPAAARDTPASVALSVLEALDRKADPCQDFYRYACGSWLDTTQIPADQPAWGRSFSTIQKRNEEINRDILEAAAKDPGPDAELAKLGRFYGTCVDEDAIERSGAAPLKPVLDRIDAVQDAGQFLGLVGELHRIEVGALFDVEVEADFKDPDTSIAFFNQGGLGLFDRDYYLEDDEQSTGLRGEYQAHVARMLALLGESAEESARGAGEVVSFETELAKVSRPRVDLRDPDKNYNRLDLVGLEKLAPAVPWSAYLAAIGYPDLRQIAVGQPEFYEGLSKIVARAQPATLRSYLRWFLVHDTAPLLSKSFVDENFAFFSATLMGQKEIKPRWKRCVAATDAALGELLGKYYIERAFAGESKTMALDLIHRIEAAFKSGLPELSWMDPATRQRALEKLASVTNKIGYPDSWRDYSSLRVERGSYFQNAAAARTFEYQRQRDKVGKPVDRKEWGLSPPTVNAYYNPLINEMVFPAGIMQPPFFERGYPVAMNYGGIGMVMGHELTHGYDDQGRKFDPKGRLSEWWEPSAVEKFEKQAACVTDLYSSYEPQPGVHVNGKLTLGENIADFGGIKEAYRAYRAWEAEQGAPSPAVDGLTNEQLFFIGFAQSWCTLLTPEIERLLITLDPHSPPRYRVNGPVSNFPEFGEVFACKEGAPMRPEKICTVW